MDRGRVMGCEEVRPDLVAMLDGELDPARLERGRAHVRTCAACVSELAGYEKVRGALASLTAAGVPSAGFDALWARAAESGETSRTSGARRASSRAGGRHTEGRSRWRRWTVPAGAVAAAAVAAIGWTLYSGPAPISAPKSVAPDRTVAAPAAPAAPVAPNVVARAPREDSRVTTARKAPREPKRAPANDIASSEAAREPARVAARATEPRVAAPAVESGVASLEPQEGAVKQAKVPRELRERPEFFMDLAVVMRLERLRELDQVLPAKHQGKGAEGSGQS